MILPPIIRIRTKSVHAYGTNDHVVMKSIPSDRIQSMRGPTPGRQGLRTYVGLSCARVSKNDGRRCGGKRRCTFVRLFVSLRPSDGRCVGGPSGPSIGPRANPVGQLASVGPSAAPAAHIRPPDRPSVVGQRDERDGRRRPRSLTRWRDGIARFRPCVGVRNDGPPTSSNPSQRPRPPTAAEKSVPSVRSFSSSTNES